MCRDLAIGTKLLMIMEVSGIRFRHGKILFSLSVIVALVLFFDQVLVTSFNHRLTGKSGSLYTSRGSHL